jgi:hypothetical protein
MKSDNTPAVTIKPEPTGNGTFTLLTGNAPAAIQAPAKLSYAGRLDTPRLFLQPKEGNYDKLQCTFEVDAENNKVRFVGTEKSHESADIITGVLVPSDAIAQFKLNTGERWMVPNLIELVKRMRPYFATQEAQIELITKLRNWSFGVTKAYEEMSSQDGNARKAVTTRVEGTPPAPFKLHMPIFKGYPKETFLVEFGVDADGSGVKLYMDSPELLDMLLTKKEEYIQEEVDYFTGFGCSVIYVS